MFSIGSSSGRVAVVGGTDPVVAGLSDAGTDLTFEAVEASLSAVTDDDRRFDCLVLDGGGLPDDGVGFLERLGAADVSLPVVVLVEGDDDQVAGAFEAGASEVLSRSLLTSAPTVVAERIGSLLAGERTRDAFDGLFDAVAGVVSYHDPTTGAFVDANGTLCSLLDHDRSALCSTTVGAVTADVPGYDDQRATNVITTARDERIEMEWPLERGDGSVVWVEWTFRPVTVGGRELVLATGSDVTERRRREREYEQIFDGVNDVISVHDPWEETMLDVNETLCDLTGYGRETLLEMGVDGVSVDDEGYTSEEAYERMRRVAATGRSETVDWVVETASGERRRLESKLSPATVVGEERVLALSRDVTERWELEQTHREVFENVSDGLVVHDPQTGEIVDVNDRYCEMTGYDRDELVGANIQLIVPDDPPETGEDVLDSLEEAMGHIERAREEGAQLFEFLGQRRDGDFFVGEVNLRTVEIRGTERVLASVRDVTERKEREHDYEQIFNGVNDIVNVYDPETRRLVAVNDTMCEVTGYDRETLLDRGLAGVSAADEGFTRDRADEIIDEVMASGESRELEWCLKTADGERRWLEVNATPATINGEERLLTISRDVTERRRTERRLGAVLDRIDEAIFLAPVDEITRSAQDPEYMSAGYEAIWGQSLADIHERYEDGFFGTLHPDDEADYRALVDRIVDEVGTDDASDRYSFEYRIERPDGTVRWVQSDYYPVDWAGGPQRIIIVSRDVTERKDRERRIVSFEAATEDLTTADTPEEAARSAVEAATDELDLAAIATLLYDEDDGVLRPEVTSASLEAHSSERAVGPGDGPLWDVFASGSVGGTSDPVGAGTTTDRTSVWSAVLADWRGIPLGNHGVLLVGVGTGTLDSSTLQSAHVLAATLEAALNHLRGQRRVASHEERLRTETERADRLDRIARLTQRVEAAITEANDPRDVERAVCNRLTDADPYDVAWIGGVDVGTDRLTARTVVGASSRYVDGMDLTTTDDETDSHPAVAAWRTDEVQVTPSLVDVGPAGGWRERELSRGFQSLCAVPLTYDGITHGVLTVGASYPHAFGDRERAVLSQLGTSIGHALAGIERRRALESDETVELEFRGDGTDLRFARLAADTDWTVRHERTVHRDDGGVSVYFTVEGADLEGAVEAAERHLLGSVDVVRDESNSILVERVADTWFGAPMAEFGAVLRRAEATPDGTTVVAELPARTDVRSFTERLQELAPSLSLEARRQHQGPDRTTGQLRNRIEARLTDRQLESLRTAFTAGYFEWPRESDGSEVADRLDITQPTFNKHLRLAEKKTFGAVLGVDEDRGETS